mmetsp:Transcript_4585/g.19555  ORF Transcript_4585/g.19555 Transcript_4585/m.19555 type:complete len:229 (+) Transcript_4585:1767-2453(+)
MVSSEAAPPCGAWAVGARPRDTSLSALRKSEAVAESRCTGMPSVRRSRRSARIASCFRRSSSSRSSSFLRSTSFCLAFSMFRSRNGRARLNISVMIASRSVGSMSFCRRPFSGRPSTVGSSRKSSSSPPPPPATRLFAAAMPALCAAAAAAASSSSSLRRSATGSNAGAAGESASSSGGGSVNHRRVFSMRNAFCVSEGKSGLFHAKTALRSTSNRFATSSSFSQPFV